MSVIREKEKEVDMKKILACMSLVFALSAGATALAAVGDVNNAYIKDGNKLDVDIAGATDKNTVLITKNGTEGSEGIVFADQNDDTFSGVASFLLKGDSLASGTYTVKMNNAKGTALTTNEFTISDAPVSEMAITTEAFIYEKTDSKGNVVYDKGFKATNANLTGINYIAITNTTAGDSNEGKTLYIQLDQTVNGMVNVAIRINDIPKDKTVSVKLVAEKPTNPSGN